MKRSILAMILISFALLTLGAPSALRAEEPQVAPLPFWGIDLKDFHADTPRPISVPGAGGVLDYYWYWTFKFKFGTNLQELRKHYDEMATKLASGAGADEAEMLRKNVTRIDDTIKGIERTHLYATIYTDEGGMITDNSNTVVRNLVEKELQHQYYTTSEIAGLNLNDVPETRDPDYGMGRWVYCVAVFNNMPPATRQFEIRVTGLGKRVLPMFLPGRLFYPAETLSMSEAIRPTMRRNLRYFYRKIGQSPELAMTPVKFEERKAEWLWVWPMQVYLGRFREVTVERSSGLKRQYVYAPYYIWNNTHLPQQLSVVKAGFAEDVVWGGAKMRVTMLDDGTPDERWKLQATDKIRDRLSSGEEKKYAEKYETYPVKYSSVNMEQYYKDNFQIPYIPQGTPAEQNALKNKLKTSDRIVKLTADLDKRKAADVARKLQYLPDGERERLFSGTIESGKIVTGVVIVRWSVENLDAVLDTLIAQLQTDALLEVPAEKGSLLEAYRALLKPVVNANAPWTRPADPAREIVVKMLLDRAAADCKALKIVVGEEDVKLYGTLAPIGALVNRLAYNKLVERADKSNATDGYFEVKTSLSGETTESAPIISFFQRFLPNEHAALPPIPDDFREEGTKAGIGKIRTSSEKSDAKEEKKDTKKAAEDVW